MLITERPGRLLRVDGKTLQPRTVRGLPAVAAVGQGGLLDVALHPEFDSNQLVYFSFSGADDDGLGTEVARGRLAGDALENVEVIFRALPKSRGGLQFGSRLLFDTDGRLLVTLGDRRDRMRAQDIGDHAGSVVRINDDGSVPADNPFVATAGARPEIYAFGNRNAQGIALDPASGRVWSHEHGPQGGDELNILAPGRNYGWPVIGYGVNYRTGSAIHEGTLRDGIEAPTHFWVPSIATSGLMTYTGDVFPAWKGSIFAGGLAGQQVARLTMTGQRVVGEETLMHRMGRVRDIRQSPDGYIYVAIESRDGSPTAVVRFEPAGAR